MNFRIKEKLMLWISRSKKNLFQVNKSVQRWSFDSIYEAWVAYKMTKGVVQLYIKDNEVIFSLAWNIVFSDNFKVLVLKFLMIGNTVFFWVKKVKQRWYLLVTVNFLFWTFRWWEIRSFFQPKSWWKDDIYLVFFSFLWYSRTWEIWFFAQWFYFKVFKF